MGQGVKILVEIDGLHDQYLSQQELFLQSAAASRRSMVDGDTSTDGNDTSTVDSGTSTVDGCILMVDGYTLIVGGNIRTIDDSILTACRRQHSDVRRWHPNSRRRRLRARQPTAIPWPSAVGKLTCSRAQAVPRQSRG
jgi:hypothetical protein